MGHYDMPVKMAHDETRNRWLHGHVDSEKARLLVSVGRCVQ